jgi:hypothetical protein
LNAEAWLAAWEIARTQPSVERALTLLVTAWPETSVSFFGGLSVGERDRRLLALREALFGTRFDAVANCPACGLRLETEFDVTDVRIPDQSEARESDELCVQAGDYEVHYRLPTSDDFLAIVRLPDCKTISGQRMALLQRCIRSARRAESSLTPNQLPQEVVNSISEQMAKSDPQADVSLALSCPECQNNFSIPFDILSYLWNEIDEWTQRLLFEVHALASAYGWGEREILEMSTQRRQTYLQMVNG